MRATSHALLAAAIAILAAGPAAAGPATAGDGPPPTRGGAWRHRHNHYLVSQLGSPRHSMADAVVAEGGAARLEGKFSYGKAGKDLEDEDIFLWLRPPGGSWLRLARAHTDGDGRVVFKVPSPLLDQRGAWACAMVVGGDGSQARGTLYVVAAGQPAVVFDVNGTLTSGDGELVEEVLVGKDPEVRPGAVEVARRWQAAGYLPVYLSGRPYTLDHATRRWLDRHGFPPGPVLAANGVRDSLSGGPVARYKTARLRALGAAGLAVRYAYGNASSDVCVYAAAGVAPAHTFIIGEHGGEACRGHAPTEAVRDYRTQLPALERLLAPDR